MEPIDPRVDIAFKKIFGVDENRDLLISLVNSIVGTEDQVTDRAEKGFANCAIDSEGAAAGGNL